MLIIKLTLGLGDAQCKINYLQVIPQFYVNIPLKLLVYCKVTREVKISMFCSTSSVPVLYDGFHTL